LPIVALPLPVYQMPPALSTVTVWGLDLDGSGYSFISPVFGLIRPIRSDHWPTHQMLPSGASIGSRDRWPSVGTVHSLKAILASPETSLGVRLALGGKFVARYSVIFFCSSGVLLRSIIVPVSSFQPSRVYPELCVIWFTG
jgi:hypothetical protein